MIGIDEVGRGAWAGPLLVVAARQSKDLPNGLGDSKTIPKSRRKQLAYEIAHSCDLGLGWVHAEVIDRIGLTKAMELAVKRALADINATSLESIIIDGHINYCPHSYKKVTCIVRADAIVPIVSAASIYAKVSRDDFMTEQSLRYPSYGFESHVGYGTKQHRQALRVHGVTPLHRMSYKPVKELL